jgi:hypothetical protein
MFNFEPSETGGAISCFLTTVGIPVGGTKGLLKIPPGRGENGPFVIAGLFVIMPNNPRPDSVLIRLAAMLPAAYFNPDAGDLVIFAKELAVGAKSLEDETLDGFVNDVDPAADDRPATSGNTLDPILLVPMPVAVPDSLLEDANEDRVPTDDTPPTLLPFPIFRLFWLVLVPAALIRLLLVDVDGVGPKVGMGDLAPDAGALRREDVPPPPDDFAVVGREVARGTLTLFLTLLGTTLGTLDDAVVAGAAVFPRPKTFCTRDLAEDRNPNLEGFGCGFTVNTHLV